MAPLANRSFTLMCCALLATIRLAAGQLQNAAMRTAPPATWQRLTADKAFGYRDEIEKLPVREQQSGFMQMLLGLIVRFFASGAGLVLVWVLVLALASYIIYRMFISRDSFLFGRSKKMERGTDADEEEDIAATNWPALFHTASAGGDMRLAVRYSYMWLLQLLQQNNLIQYRRDKTNHEYLTELTATQHRIPFRLMSGQYEYTWYGRYALSPGAYQAYLDTFNDLKKQLGA